MTDFSPREIVSELDRFIVGQNDAKRAVSIGAWVHRVAALETRVPVTVAEGPPVTISAAPPLARSA